MKQQTLAMANGFERYTKKTRRTLFLEEMEQVVPWAELCALVEPVYAKAGNGRPPVGAERMLRILQEARCRFKVRSNFEVGIKEIHTLKTVNPASLMSNRLGDEPTGPSPASWISRKNETIR